jgi:hypothetical protein
MPKDEFDFEDPLELSGVGLLTGEDTTGPMCECFIEEFMRMGYNARQILAMFRNPHYIGMNMVLQNRGEPFVREQIETVFARWGRAVTLPASAEPSAPAEQDLQPPAVPAIEMDSTQSDPMGAAIPKLNL